MVDSWSIRQSSGSPSQHGRDDVPALLRRVAEKIEQHHPVEVEDIFFDTEMTAEGPWYNVTVYCRYPEGRLLRAVR